MVDLMILQSETQAVADYSGALHQQFSHLKLPSDTLPDVSDANHFVQSYNGSTNLLGLMDAPNEIANGLKLVGSIPISLSSSLTVSTTSTLSYATLFTTVHKTSSAQKASDEVRLLNSNLVTAFPVSNDQMVDLQLEMETQTTLTPTVYVLSVTVDDVEEDKQTSTKNTEEQEERKIDKTSKMNPIESTVSQIPEPQRASTPNVAEDHLQMMNETIVAGNLENIGQVKSAALPPIVNLSEVVKAPHLKNIKDVKKKLPLTMLPKRPTIDLSENVMPSKKANDVHNNTYCRNWVLNAGKNENVAEAQSDLSQSNKINSNSLLDITSISRNVPECKQKNQQYFYSEKSVPNKTKAKQSQKEEAVDR